MFYDVEAGTARLAGGNLNGGCRGGSSFFSAFSVTVAGTFFAPVVPSFVTALLVSPVIAFFAVAVAPAIVFASVVPSVVAAVIVALASSFVVAFPPVFFASAIVFAFSAFTRGIVVVIFVAALASGRFGRRGSRFFRRFFAFDFKRIDVKVQIVEVVVEFKQGMFKVFRRRLAFDRCRRFGRRRHFRRNQGRGDGGNADRRRRQFAAFRCQGGADGPRADLFIRLFLFDRSYAGVGGNDFDRFVEKVFEQLPRQGENKPDDFSPGNEA